jgi:AcrR family transcriptional regulator
MTIDGRAARWVGHRDRRRAELVAAAVDAIEAHGPDVTVEQIAARIGATRQVLYRQFVDRDDLDRAVAEHAATLLVEHLSPQLVLDRGLETGVRQAVTAYLDFVQQHLSLYRFVRAHDSDTAPGAVRRVKSSVADVVTTLGRTLQAEQGPLQIAPHTVAVALAGLADAVIADWLEEPKGVAQDQLVDELVRMCTAVVTASTAAPGAVPPR